MIAYNSRTNALAMIERSKYEKYRNFDDGLFADEILVDDLKKGGFLIDDSIDELKLLRYQMLNHRYAGSVFSLTIAPTLDCDFACIYCYEKGTRQGYMAREMQDAIVETIEHQTKKVNHVFITWYGGEPLLGLDVIECISDRVISLCKENEIHYGSGIVTNGYNLTKDTALKLKKLGVKSIQITLDGAEKTHNSRRPLRDGGGTFGKIINNIIECKGVFPNISLRVNIDRGNTKELMMVLNLMERHNLQDYVSVYPGYVEPTNDCYAQEDCLAFSDFAKLEYEFNDQLVDSGLIKSVLHKYPILRSNVCGADNCNSFVVDPAGNLYKCWSDIGRAEYKVNNILDFDATNIDVLLEYMLYDPTMDVECKVCKLLPICMGGCPRRRIDGVVDRCTTYKYVLEEYIRKIAYQRLHERRNMSTGLVVNE